MSSILPHKNFDFIYKLAQKYNNIKFVVTGKNFQIQIMKILII